MPFDLADAALQARLSAVWGKATGRSLRAWQPGLARHSWVVYSDGVRLTILSEGAVFPDYNSPHYANLPKYAAGIRALHRELREARGEVGA